MWWQKIDVISEAGTLHFHFMGEYSKLDRVKTMGSRGKINAIWRNIRINLQKLVDTCGYELPTNLQNFMQKDLTEVKIFLNVLGGGGYFLWNARYILDGFWTHSVVSAYGAVQALPLLEWNEVCMHLEHSIWHKNLRLSKWETWKSKFSGKIEKENWGGIWLTGVNMEDVCVCVVVVVWPERSRLTWSASGSSMNGGRCLAHSTNINRCLSTASQSTASSSANTSANSAASTSAVSISVSAASSASSNTLASRPLKSVSVLVTWRSDDNTFCLSSCTAVNHTLTPSRDVSCQSHTHSVTLRQLTVTSLDIHSCQSHSHRHVTSAVNHTLTASRDVSLQSHHSKYTAVNHTHTVTWRQLSITHTVTWRQFTVTSLDIHSCQSHSHRHVTSAVNHTLTASRDVSLQSHHLTYTAVNHTHTVTWRQLSITHSHVTSVYSHITRHTQHTITLC